MNERKKLFEVLRDLGGIFSSNGYNIVSLGRKIVRLKGEDYDLTPKILTLFSDTRYNFNKIDMCDKSVLTFDKILGSLDCGHAKILNQNALNLLKSNSKNE